MSLGKKLVEVGPVCIRENEEYDNLDYNLTDYHSGRYPVADDDELRAIRDAINQLLGDDE